jgi:hypothetical protein
MQDHANDAHARADRLKSSGMSQCLPVTVPRCKAPGPAIAQALGWSTLNGKYNPRCSLGNLNLRAHARVTGKLKLSCQCC